MKELTRAEEQVMQILWERGPCFVRDILEAMDEPKPAYNTVSTIVRILENKGFAGHEAFGKSHRYHTILSREDYRRSTLSRMVHSYFDNSPKSLMSHFIKEQNLTLSELDELLSIIKTAKKDNL